MSFDGVFVFCQTCFDLFGSFADVALSTVVAVEHVDGVAFVRCRNLVFVFGKIRCNLV